jgi:hypothetical protein
MSLTYAYIEFRTGRQFGIPARLAPETILFYEQIKQNVVLWDNSHMMSEAQNKVKEMHLPA